MNSRIESLLRQDRAIVAGSLVFVSALSWGYLFMGAGMDMMVSPEWDAGYIIVMFLMWWVMMIAMMLPSATPVILLSTALNRRSQSTKPPFGNTIAFTAGYLTVWGLFSMLAVLLQWLLQSTGLISNMLESNSILLTTSLLVAAGAWQFVPLKNACLEHCRNPIEYLTAQKRRGTSGALLTGFKHGTYCLGCCWFLMALLFVGGAMNLIWIAGLAIYVWIEKFLPASKVTSKVTGGLLIVWGIGILASDYLS
jgi:predicted metal-binding membrane protein